MNFLEELELIDPEKEQIKKVNPIQPSIDIKQPEIQESGKGYNNSTINQQNDQKPVNTITTNTKELTPEERLNELYETLAPQRDTNKEERLKKVAAYNAIGQGLTNIIDAFYGNKGAKIPVRQDKLTPYLMASLNAEDQKFDAEKARYNNAKLSQAIQNINLERENQQRQSDWDKKKDLIDYEYQRRNELESAQNQNDIDKINQKYDRMIELAKLNNASDEKQNQARISNKENKKGFGVVYGYDKERQPKEVKLSDGVFRDVLKRTMELKGMNNDDVSNLIAKYKDPNTDKKTKNQIEEIVIKNWNKFYDVNDSGGIYLKEKEGPLYDNNIEKIYSNDEKAPQTKRFNVGGTIYNIPSDKVDEFKKDFPNAKEL